MKNSFKISFVLQFVVFGFFLFTAGFVFADYSPLVSLPGLQEGSTTIPAFINRVYILTIVLGSLLGVVKIAIAGAKYSMGDVITDKQAAKKDIMGVLLGLVVLLAPWIVLNTIYPGLLNLDFTKNINNVGDLTHDNLRDAIRNENPVVIDTFTGVFGSEEHIAFVKSCKDGGGEVALAEDGVGVECRVKSSGTGEDFYTHFYCSSTEGKWWDDVCNQCYDTPAVAPGENCFMPSAGERVNCFHVVPGGDPILCAAWCTQEGGVFVQATTEGGTTFCDF